MESDPKIKRQTLGGRMSARIDAVLDRIYNYHGEVRNPKEVAKDTWAAPAQLPAGTPGLGDYFLHYFQSQGLGPTNNECVTTSTVMAMNLIEDRIAAGREASPQYAANLLLEDFIRDLDAQGFRGWLYRFSTKSPLPGMMTPGGARRAMKAHAARLKGKYSRSYRVETLFHQTVDDLIQALEQGKIILLHGAWQKKLSDAQDRHLALMGGMPHTMLLVGYEGAGGFWNLLNPAEPWLKSRTTGYHPHLFLMTTQQLMDFWGRKFLFYPPRFAITTLTEE